VGTAEWGPVYPMDYYRKDAGTWNNYYQDPQEAEAEARRGRQQVAGEAGGPNSEVK
jgi:hypothetical protein